MTTDIDREKLRELCERATPGPWRWWTSCSWRRLSSDAWGNDRNGKPLDRDGGIICPYVCRDGHPDLIITEEDADFIAAARTALPALLDLTAAQAAEIKKQHDMGHQAFLIGVKHQDRADALMKEVEAQAAKIAELEGERRTLGNRVYHQNNELDEKDRCIAKLKAENARLHGLINTPHTDDWLVAVPLEAAHQIERWSADHDAGKTPLDWFWLIGYLAQKVVHAADKGDIEKAKHHTISTGAALLNWWQQIRGYPNQMRPGIKPPEGEINDAA